MNTHRPSVFWWILLLSSTACGPEQAGGSSSASGGSSSNDSGVTAGEAGDGADDTSASTGGTSDGASGGQATTSTAGRSADGTGATGTDAPNAAGASGSEPCPVGPPADDAPCSSEGLVCEYAGSSVGVTATCVNGSWAREDTGGDSLYTCPSVLPDEGSACPAPPAPTYSALVCLFDCARKSCNNTADCGAAQADCVKDEQAGKWRWTYKRPPSSCVPPTTGADHGNGAGAAGGASGTEEGGETGTAAGGASDDETGAVPTAGGTGEDTPGTGAGASGSETCPAGPPTADAPCSTEGLVCEYAGSSVGVIATCDGGAWVREPAEPPQYECPSTLPEEGSACPAPPTPAYSALACQFDQGCGVAQADCTQDAETGKWRWEYKTANIPCAAP